MRTLCNRFCCISVLLLIGCGGDRSNRDVATQSAPKAGGDLRPQPNQDLPTADPSPPVNFELVVDGFPTEGIWKCVPDLADVNEDGWQDVAVIVRRGDGPHVFLNQQGRGWQDASQGLGRSEETSCGGGVELADIDGDGRLDLAAGDHCAGIFIYRGLEGPGWEPVVEKLKTPDDIAVPKLVGVEDIAVGDVNGDGHLDLAVGAFDAGGVQLFTGDGTLTNWQWAGQGLPTEGWANRVKLADIDGDADLDLVAARSIGPRVFLNDGQGNWTESSAGLPSPPVHGIYWGLDVADVNGDKRPDLVLGNWINGVEIHLQQADGSWAMADDPMPMLLGGAHGVAVGDVTGDGNVDIVAVGRLTKDVGHVYGVFLLIGDGEGGFAWADNVNLPATGLEMSWGVQLADIDNDDRLDIVVASGAIVPKTPDSMNPVLESRVLAWRTVVTD